MVPPAFTLRVPSRRKNPLVKSMKVTMPFLSSMPLEMKTSPAMMSPCTDRLAEMAAKPPRPGVGVQVSAPARPLWPATTQAAGAWAKSCWTVSRLAGRSISRLRGKITRWSPTVIRPADQWSPGVTTDIDSISPMIVTCVGVVGTAADAGVSWVIP